VKGNGNYRDQDWGVSMLGMYLMYLPNVVKGANWVQYMYIITWMRDK
jgi:hypothetical protein